jgi:hypothetical protein
MPPHLVLPARRVFLALAALAVLAAVLVWATGGFGMRIGVLRVSAHNPLRPLLLAAFLSAGWVVLGFVPGGATSAAQEWTWWRTRLPRPRLWSWPWFHPTVVIAIVCAAADVAQWLRRPPLWLDEQMIAINLRDRSFADLTGTLWLGQSAPLAWLWAQRAVLLTFGSEELVLRLVPLIFGIATLAVAAWIGRRWLSPLTASLFVLLCWIGAALSHYRFELKHYSADVFFALLLPALAVWTFEAASPSHRLRRQVAWFAAAGAGLWFANGALFVAPGCVLWMLFAHVRERDVAGAARFAAAGIIWLAMFAGHYSLSLRYTHQSTYLRQHWADRVAPASGQLAETAAWFGPQLEAVGRDAASTRRPLLFWMVALGGLMIASRRRLAAVYGLVPVTAVTLALFRLVPFYERFSLWIVPALYLGLTLAIGRGGHWLLDGYRRRQAGRLLAGAVTGAVALVVAADVIDHGWGNIDVGVPAESNHSMDDRSGVPWLMLHRQPGDALVTTRLGWPAIWWYGGIPLPQYEEGRLPDGTALYELTYHPYRQHCRALVEPLGHHGRVLVYVSFPDLPRNAYPLLEREVDALGTIAAQRQFTSETRGLVIRVDGAVPQATAAPGGCVDVTPARRW